MGGMVRYLRLWAAFFRNCITREMEYRGHFFMQFMIDMAWYAVQIALFEVIYLSTNSVAGMTHEEMIVFLGAMFVIDAINMIFFSHNFWMFPGLIARGELDFYIIKPVSTFFMSFTRFPNIASWLNLAVGVSVLVYGLLEANIAPSMGEWAMFLLLAVCGNAIMLAMQAMVASVAVFLVQAEGIQMIFHTLYQFSIRPDAIYGHLFRRILLYFFPLALIVSVPSRALLGTLTPEMALWNIAASIIIFYLATRFFTWSLKHYSGASA